MGSLRKRGALVEEGLISEMSEKEVAIRMQKQGNEYVVVVSGSSPKFAKTVKEAGDMAKGVKGAKVMKMTEYMRSAANESVEGGIVSMLGEGMGRLTLVPAYGRDYKSKKEVEEAWKLGKDFMISDMSSPWDGKMINLQDAKADGSLRQVNIRYKKMTQVTVIDVK